MKRIFLPRLRTLWVILIVITLLPVAVFSLRTRQVLRGEAETVARENILRVVRLAADRHQRLLESTQQVLFLMARLPALRTGDLEACNRLFTDLHQQYPRYANLGMAYLNGSIAASAMPARQTANVADRPWFQRLAQNPDLEPGDYHVDEISGKPVVVLGHPVLDNSGRLKFIAFAALDLNWINQVFAAAGLPAGSVMTLSGADGRILARTLEPGKWIGSPGPEAAVINNIAPERDATAERPGVDGIRRLYGFTRLHGRGNEASAYVSVGIPATDAYAGADRALPRTLMILALTSALALAAAWLVGETFIGRGVRSLRETLQRLQKGDLTARPVTRTEAAELRELSNSVDAMACEVQSQAEKNRRHLEAARESETRLHLELHQLPVLIWSTDKDLHVGYMLGGGLNGLKGRAPGDDPSSVSDWFRSIAPGFAPDEPHLRALQGERVAGEIDLADGGVQYVLAPLRDPEGGITGCIGVAWDITARKKLEQTLRNSERQIKQALDAAVQKIAGFRQSEESMQEEVRHLKEALRATALEIAQYGRSEEAQRRKEGELRQCLESSVAEVASLRVTLQDVREELKKAQSSAEAASAEAARYTGEGQVLGQRVQLLEADLEIERARSAESRRLELAAREEAQRARDALETSTAEINRRMQTDLELKEGVRQIKVALETAAGEVTELQDEVELLRANERHLNEALQAAETRCANYQRALESAIADLERQKRASARSHAKDALTERQTLAQKLDEEVASSLAGIKTGLESMHKMAGKSPLGLRLQESVNSLESARQKIRNLAKGLVTTGGP